MALNPLAYTEKVVRGFLRYQLTTYDLADSRLSDQMRELLSLDSTRDTPLLKGPYVSLSRAFQAGASIDQMVDEGIFLPHMKQLIPFEHLYGHQEAAIRAISAGKTTLISTGTGSGKTECFLYPVINRCLELRNREAEPGICAVLVYPMNALAEDQLLRMRGLLAGTRISFGMYIGKTPENEAGVTGLQLEAGASGADYEAALADVQKRGEGRVVHPPEEICSRELMRTPGHQPRILLTNVKQLELLLTREKDVELFDNARLDFLVFDEAHTFAGAQGAETACLIRRLRSFCGKGSDETVHVATSATIVDEGDPDAARTFASRFFGVDRDRIEPVHEIYEREVWAEPRLVPGAPKDPVKALDRALRAVDAEDPLPQLRSLWKELAGAKLPEGSWEEALHEDLSRNQLLFLAADLLAEPRPLAELLGKLQTAVEREITEEELILWLTLGAAARTEDRPLIRPVVHGFLRGVPGAIVTFDPHRPEPKLHLSAEDEEKTEGEGTRLRFPLFTCTTCGQHYFEHYLARYEYTGARPEGAQADGERGYWKAMDAALGGDRALFVDRLISEGEEDDDAELSDNKSLSPVHLCVHCGAAHGDPATPCLGCGSDDPLIDLQAVQLNEKHPQSLKSCLGCGAHGREWAGRYRESIKPIRAANVADVHVLAQEMIQHAERKRLLLFADNRQDAAFQAGWMKDHARRYRLRALIVEGLNQRPQSVGDLVHWLDAILDADDSMSRALVPEAWERARKESSGKAHQEERRYLVRILVLRELTTSKRQGGGLEPWGRLKVNYETLSESHGFVQEWADRLGFPADELAGGIAAVLDHFRRRMILLDRQDEIFTHTWGDGHYEVQYGYLPRLRAVPKGLTLKRRPSDDEGRLTQWTSETHHLTLMRTVARKWGVEGDQVDSFLEELWEYLTSETVALLVPVTLKGWKGGALPRCQGGHQIDGDKLALHPHKGVYICRTCQQRSVRRTPGMKCLAWRCTGTLEFLPEVRDNYDLNVLDGDYTLLRPREHTAMVPNHERERIEQIFKGAGKSINTLVCTQTLELGVDIGALDAVLMRNVPPLPANYRQRAGRAGRRHRMAVNITYCRGTSHDRAYFEQPLKMLGGQVEPPTFNLSNEVMVGKHVRATVLTALHQLARESSGLAPFDRNEIRRSLDIAFPTLVTDYLFDHGHVRPKPRDVRPLYTVTTKHKSAIEERVRAAFQQGWPTEDQSAVAPEKLAGWVIEMTDELEQVVERLYRRLKWALDQMEMLERRRKLKGVLDDEEDAFYRRCKLTVKRLKGKLKRARSEAEGINDVWTYAVLSADGFLPGYGLETGSVLGTAMASRARAGAEDFLLPRPPSIALREYVPGNLIYANGQKFVARQFDLATGEGKEAIRLEVLRDRQTVRGSTGASSAIGSLQITSLPVCDVTLVHSDRISDEEEIRFQMAVEIYGRERGFHDGGKAYEWGGRPVHFRRGVGLQLVNVGSRSVMAKDDTVGFPVCRVCGQSVSPFSSERQRETFAENHLDWCGQKPEPVAFHADMVADALLLPRCEDKREACSLAEGLRFGAASVLDMELEDLQILVLGRSDGEELDALIYDPMPGGSGLLQQLFLRFEEVVEEARRIAGSCPSRCGSSCIDCFQIYRNAFYHEHLDRNVVLEAVRKRGAALQVVHEIPPVLPPAGEEDAGPTNMAEEKLRVMLKEAGFPPGHWQEQVPLAKPWNSTTPDVAWDQPHDEELKIFVYLDGLSEHIHGNPETEQRDKAIRAELRADGHEVIEITAHDLDDPKAMNRHFRLLARKLLGREKAREVDYETERWFQARERAGVEERPGSEPEGPTAPVFLFRNLGEEDVPDSPRAVPLFDVRAAAGGFSEGQTPEPEGWIDVERTGIGEGWFAATVVGRSMEPTVLDGSLCLFRRDVGGSRYGRTLLVQHREIYDSDTGGSFTLKRYRRPAGKRSGPIELAPDNPAFQPILLEEEHADELEVIGELVGVLEKAAREQEAEESWDEDLDLLNPAWQELGRGLEEAGIPRPAMVWLDLEDEEGRVTEHRAIFAWRREGELFGLSHPGSPGDDEAWISVNPETDVEDVLPELREKFGVEV